MLPLFYSKKLCSHYKLFFIHSFVFLAVLHSHLFLDFGFFTSPHQSWRARRGPLLRVKGYFVKMCCGGKSIVNFCAHHFFEDFKVSGNVFSAWGLNHMSRKVKLCFAITHEEN
eukprot:RCo052980